MKKIKNIITMVVLAAVVISMIWFYQVCINIPVETEKWLRLGLAAVIGQRNNKLELDRFFGEENWECISKEKKDSIILEDSQYTNWSIRFKDKYGEEHTAVITNHVFWLIIVEKDIPVQKDIVRNRRFIWSCWIFLVVWCLMRYIMIL